MPWSSLLTQSILTLMKTSSQVFISYPTVVPTVEFKLEASDELISMADQITGHGKEAAHDFMIGILINA